MSNFARHLVSQHKSRTVNKDVPKGSVDLDLTEVHKRIVCMGYPATGVKTLYRNSYEDSLRYLDYKYGDKYMVYNLCEEKEYHYSLDKFHGRVRCFPFLDHHAAPLALITAFVKDAVEWINADPKNVVVVHCKAGLGRTGLMVCCLMLAIEPLLQGSAAAAIRYYGDRRTLNGKGLSVPGQRRAVLYYQRLRNEFGGEVPDTVPTVRINEIRLVHFAPKISVHSLCFSNDKDKTVLLRVKDIKKKKKSGSLVMMNSTFTVTEAGVREDVVTFDCRADDNFAGLRGDIKLVIKDGNGTIGILAINTLFMHHSYDAREIDKLCYKTLSDPPCALEFDFDVTAGERATTPAVRDQVAFPGQTGVPADAGSTTESGSAASSSQQQRQQSIPHSSSSEAS